MDNTSFNFKEIIKQRIRDDIKPIMKQEGFVSLPSYTFMREKEGLLQILYFKVQNTRLRPWAYFLPIYLPCTNNVSYGTDGTNVDVSLRLNNPYAGFGWVFVYENADKTKQYKDYITNAAPRFDALVSSIKKSILPEMDRISSLTRFVESLRTDRFLWGNTVRRFPTEQHIIDIACQTGVQRIKTLKAGAEELSVLTHKSLLDIILEVNVDVMSNQDADVWFDKYCNSVRDKFKLPRQG